jgi:hypothetical protein
VPSTDSGETIDTPDWGIHKYSNEASPQTHPREHAAAAPYRGCWMLVKGPDAGDKEGIPLFVQYLETQDHKVPLMFF